MTETRHPSASGFTLVEVLVVVGIMAVVGLGFASMLSGMSRSQKDIEARQNIATLSDDIRTILGGGSTCIAAVGAGQVFNAAQAATPQGAPFRATIYSEPFQAGADSRNYGLRVDRFVLKDAVRVGDLASGEDVFLARLAATFTGLSGSHFGFKERSLGTYYFTLNGANVITACSNVDPVPAPTPAPTPTPTPAPVPDPTPTPVTGGGGGGSCTAATCGTCLQSVCGPSGAVCVPTFAGTCANHWTGGGGGGTWNACTPRSCGSCKVSVCSSNGVSTCVPTMEGSCQEYWDERM